MSDPYDVGQPHGTATSVTIHYEERAKVLAVKVSRMGETCESGMTYSSTATVSPTIQNGVPYAVVNGVVVVLRYFYSPQSWEQPRQDLRNIASLERTIRWRGHAKHWRVIEGSFIV